MSVSQQNESLMTYINSTVLMGVLVITIIIMILKSRRQIVLANQIPGPRGSIIIGNLLLFMDGPELLIGNFSKEYRKYEKSLYKFWILNRLYIVLTKPEDIEMVFTDRKYVNKSQEYDIFQDSIMGQGLLSTSDTHKWKNNRKIITKGLNFALLKSFIPIMFEEASDLAEILQEKRDQKSNECEIYDLISMATIEIIGRTAMGVTFNAQRGGQNTFVENFYKIIQAWEYRIEHPWYLNKTLYHFSSAKRQHDRSQKIINVYVNEIIKSKTIELSQNERADDINTKTQNEDSCQKIQTLIEILLQNSHGMSHQQMRDEIRNNSWWKPFFLPSRNYYVPINGEIGQFTMVDLPRRHFAVAAKLRGYETSTMVNSCVILMLAFHQDIQDKVYEELESIFPADDDRHRPPTYEDLQQMKYLERVIKDTMRLYPPLPLIGRSLNEDTKIGGYLCPAGATLLVSTSCLHTSPLYYDNPNRFDPDNFLPEAVRSRHPYTWIPFSAGIRNCIGSKFAMLQIKTIISTMLRRFKFFPSERCLTPEDMRLMFLVTLRFVNGCHVRIEPRT